MRLAIIYLACISLFTLAYTHSTKIADKEFLNKQKFLFEIVHRIDDPLRFAEWIKLGDQLIVDKSYYNVSRKQFF